MKAEVKTVTPEMAKEYLKLNTSNRTLRTSKVRAYARDMLNGTWQLTGQGITISKDGVLLDGQHRLEAIVLANKPIDMLVVTEADNTYMYDCGLKRSYGDHLKIANKNMSSTLFTPIGTGTLRVAYSLNLFGGPSASQISSACLQDVVEYDRENLEWIVRLFDGVKVKGIRRAIVPGTLYMIFKSTADLSKSDIEHIAYVLEYGIPGSERDFPLIALRDKLMTDLGRCGVVKQTEDMYRISYAVQQYLKGTCTKKNVKVQNLPYDFKGILNTKNI